MKKYIKKCKGRTISYGVMELFVAVENVLLAYVFRFIVAIAAGENERTIADGLLVVFLYLVLNIGGGFLFYYCKERFRTGMMTEIRNDVFDHFMGRKFEKYYKSNTGEYLSVLSNDLKLVEENAILPVFNCIQYAATLLLAFIAIWNVEHLLAPVLLLAAIATMLIGKIYSVGLSEAAESHMSEAAQYQKKAKDAFAGYEIIQNFGILRTFCRKHAEWNAALEEKRYRSNIRLDRASCLSNSTNLLIQCMVFVVCAWLVLKGRLTISQLTLVSSLTNQLFYPLFQIVDEMNCYRSTEMVRKKLADITAGQPEEKTAKADILQHEIRFENVSFGYEANSMVLKNFNAVFEKGKKYAVIGSSGSGKSTVLRLLLHYYDGYEGSILWDGRETGIMSEESLRTRCSVIPQNVFLFDDTLYCNLTLYQDYSEERIRDAIKKAGLEGVVERLEKGLDTAVTENGNNFSGGEKQRIAVARALLSGNNLVLMDEATANVDRNTAAAIERIILEESGLTCISVMHHFTVQNMRLFDKILVLENGAVAEEGSYDELLMQKGVFSRLCSTSL